MLTNLILLVITIILSISSFASAQIIITPPPSPGSIVADESGPFSSLPVSPSTGDIYRITDAVSTTNCTQGSGPEIAFCLFNGSAWVAISVSNGAVTVTSRDPVAGDACNLSDRWLDTSTTPRVWYLPITCTVGAEAWVPTTADQAIVIAQLSTIPLAEAVRTISDGLTETDCSVGGGGFRHDCSWDSTDSTWVLSGAFGLQTSCAQGSGCDFIELTEPRPLRVAPNGLTGVRKITHGAGGDLNEICLDESGDYCDQDIVIAVDKEFCIGWVNGDPPSRSNLGCVENVGVSGIGTSQLYTGIFSQTKTIWIPSASMSASGGCSDPTHETLIASGPRRQTIVCTDADVDSIEFDWAFSVSDRWNASTIQVQLYGYSVTNQTTEIVEFDFAGQCVRDGDDVAVHATTGEQAASLTFGAQAADEQISSVSSAITLQGTCNATSHIYMRGQVDATATTYSPMSDFRVLGVKVIYTQG